MTNTTAMYYAAETTANGTVIGKDLWQTLKAKTLTGAKRAASNIQMFQGTTIHLAVRTCNGDYIRVAVKRGDALNMSSSGNWEETSN